MQERIQRRGFSGTCRPRDEEYAVRAADDLVDYREIAFVESKVAHLHEISGFREKTQRYGLAPGGRHRGNADVYVFAADSYADASVHRQAFFRYIKVRHDLYARDYGGFEPVQLRGHVDLVQHSVDAVAYAQFRLHRLHVYIGGALAVGLGDDLVYEFDDGRLFAHLAHVDF